MSLKADHAFENGDIRLGSQKLWDAAASLVEAIARQRGWSHETPSDLAAAADRLAGEYDYDPDLGAEFGAAADCLENVRNEFMKQRDIDYIRKAVPHFIDNVEKLQA